MANKTNVTINGIQYYQIRRKVGEKRNAAGVRVPDYHLFRGRNKKEAEEKYQAYMKKASLSADSLGGSIEKWITDVFVLSVDYSDGTKQRYINAYTNNLADLDLFGQPIADINTQDLQAALNSLTCGFSTVKACVKVLRLFYKYALNIGLVNTDATAALKVTQKQDKKADTQTEKDIAIWSDDEITKILTASEDHRHRLLVVLLLHTGCRISELLALKWSDIDADTIRINKQVVNRPQFKDGIMTGTQLEIGPTKTASSVRSIPITADTAAEISSHKDRQQQEMLKKGYRTDFVFTTDTGRLYDIRNLEKAFKRLHRSAGVKHKGFHTYRHTFGTRLANNGTPIQTVSALMGHSDISVTAKYYINVASDQKKSAINTLVF